MDVPPFELRPAAYAYMQVADHLALRIEAGKRPREDRPAGALPPESRLPGEQPLAEEYGVALNTVRRAVQELRDRGLVTTLPSLGTFVAAAPEGSVEG